MNLNKKAEKIMTTELTTVQEETPYGELKDLFKRRGFHHLLVENKEGELKGIISTEDLGRIAHFSLFEDKIVARHIMTVSSTTVNPDTPIRKIVELFLDQRFRAVPVVNDDGKLMGIVTPHDIMHELLESD